MFLAMLIFLLATILALEVARLLKNRRWGELGAFLFLWALAAFLSGAAVLGVELPIPTDLLTALFSIH